MVTTLYNTYIIYILVYLKRIALSITVTPFFSIDKLKKINNNILKIIISAIEILLFETEVVPYDA